MYFQQETYPHKQATFLMKKYTQTHTNVSRPEHRVKQLCLQRNYIFHIDCSQLSIQESTKGNTQYMPMQTEKNGKMQSPVQYGIMECAIKFRALLLSL